MFVAHFVAEATAVSFSGSCGGELVLLGVSGVLGTGTEARSSNPPHPAHTHTHTCGPAAHSPAFSKHDVIGSEAGVCVWGGVVWSLRGYSGVKVKPGCVGGVRVCVCVVGGGVVWSEAGWCLRSRERGAERQVSVLSFRKRLRAGTA